MYVKLLGSINTMGMSEEMTVETERTNYVKYQHLGLRWFKRNPLIPGTPAP